MKHFDDINVRNRAFELWEQAAKLPARSTTFGMKRSVNWNQSETRRPHDQKEAGR